MSHDQSVVVVGGSIAGLLAAAAAHPHARRVVVLDRDHFPERPGPRSGTPHAAHSHGLLASGRESMEALLPGLTEELVSLGAVSEGDIGSVGRWWLAGGLLAECELGRSGLAVSRPTLEHVVRRRVQALPGVELRQGVHVAGLLGTAEQVEAVLLRRRDGAAEAVLEADLVVDATGRAARSCRWLPELGAAAPEEEHIEVGVRYVTVHVAARPGDVGGRSVVVSAATPEVPSGGVALRQEDGTWSVTLFTYAHREVPLDPDGLRQHAAALVSPDLAALLADRPLFDAVPYRFPDCRWRRFDRLRLPLGYAVIGDAVCSLDPTLGQGMSVAALEAVALREAIARGPEAVRTDYHVGSEAIVGTAWSLVQAAVLPIPGVLGETARTPAAIARYVARLQRVARRDPVVAAAFLRVTNLLAPPPSLLAPSLAARVLRPRRLSSSAPNSSDPEPPARGGRRGGARTPAATSA